MPREKILILALPGIGDALLATPMIELLRKTKPDAEIHAFVMFSSTLDMYEHDPFIDKVHHYDFLNASKLGALKFVTELRRMRFDISINIYPQNRREYNTIGRMIGAKRRLAVKYRRRDPQNFSWLNTDTILEDDTLHCVEENVRLLSLLGIQQELHEKSLPKLRLNLAERHLEWADTWMHDRKFGNEDLLVGIHAGTALFKIIFAADGRRKNSRNLPNALQKNWEPKFYSSAGRTIPMPILLSEKKLERSWFP